MPRMSKEARKERKKLRTQTQMYAHEIRMREDRGATHDTELQTFFVEARRAEEALAKRLVVVDNEVRIRNQPD